MVGSAGCLALELGLPSSRQLLQELRPNKVSRVGGKSMAKVGPGNG